MYFKTTSDLCLCALLLHICFAGTQASYYLCSSCTSKQHWTCALYAFLLHLCFAGTHFSTKMSKRNQNYSKHCNFFQIGNSCPDLIHRLIINFHVWKSLAKPLFPICPKNVVWTGNFSKFYRFPRLSSLRILKTQNIFQIPKGWESRKSTVFHTYKSFS